MPTTKPLTAPERIWLQLRGDGDTDSAYPTEYTENESWCWERIHDADDEYVRADLFDALEADNADLAAVLRQYRADDFCPHPAPCGHYDRRGLVLNPLVAPFGSGEYLTTTTDTRRPQPTGVDLDQHESAAALEIGGGFSGVQPRRHDGPDNDREPRNGRYVYERQDHHAAS